MLFNMNFYLLIFLSTGIFYTIHSQQSNDHMCPQEPEILCVRDVLLLIATVAKSVNRTANEIEKHILSNITIVGSLNRYVNFEMGLIHTHLPIPQLHIRFFQENNIDKRYLTYLILEAHYALSYYFNSINDILNMNDVFSVSIDTWLKQIRVNLKSYMICRYRSILNVYSHTFPFITQVKQIQFSQRRYANLPSLVHNGRSIIVVRLLREWMQRINSVIIELEKKFI